MTIAAVLRYTGSAVTLAAISRADLRFVLLGLMLHVLFWLLWAVRLWFITSLVAGKIGYISALKAILASNFMAAVTPASLGGEPMRIKALNDAGVSCGCGTAAVFAERVLDSSFFLAALLIFLAFSDFSRGFGLKVALAFLVVFILFLIFMLELLRKPMRIERMMAWLKKRFGNRKIINFIDQEVWTFRDAALQLASCARAKLPIMLAMTAAMWLTEFSIPSVLLMSFGQSPSLLNSVTSQLIIVLVAGIPLTPGSSGLVELSMSYLYSTFVPAYLLGILVLVWRVTTYFTNLVVGAPFAGASIQCGIKSK